MRHSCRWIFPVIALCAPVAAHADDLCPDDPVASLETAISQVDETYLEIDESAFDRAAKQLDAVISCLDQAPPGASLARLHQSMALVAFVNGQKTAARRAMAAARLADPTWKPSADLFPEGHPFRSLWAAATDPGPTSPLGTIEPRQWLIDGIARDDAPTERGFLLQVQDGNRVTASEYLYDQEDLPDFGQDTSVPSWVTPRTLELSAGAALRFLSAEQTATGTGAIPLDEAALGGGGTLGLRVTPITFAGLEAHVAALGGADPVQGGRFGLESEFVGLFGAALPVGEDGDQLYANLRVGYARDAVFGWIARANDAVDTVVFPVNNLVTGAEVGFRTDAFDARGSFDTLLAGSSGLYELRFGAHGAARLAKPVALQLGLSGRTGGIEITGDRNQKIGGRSDVELRIDAGPALWFE